MRSPITLIRPLVSRGIVPSLLVLSAACAPLAEGPKELCRSVACVAQTMQVDARNQCLADLFRHDRVTPREQQRINRAYRYPLTNSQTYFNLARRGIQGPTPEGWCSAYAQRGWPTALSQVSHTSN